jgi:hypothetical protein
VLLAGVRSTRVSTCAKIRITPVPEGAQQISLGALALIFIHKSISLAKLPYREAVRDHSPGLLGLGCSVLPLLGIAYHPYLRAKRTKFYFRESRFRLFNGRSNVYPFNVD